MKKIIVGILSLCLIGCAVHTPKGSVIIDPDGQSVRKHCPPGQAKKGRC